MSVTTHYVSGSRADFGLMSATLRRLQQMDAVSPGIVVTGQHLLEQYGSTVSDVIESGVPIVHRVPVKLSGADGAEMGLALSVQISGFLRFWQTERPDLVMLLGDRGEMVAGALAAVHLGIHVVHLHGGELSGTLDESFRHAISKLAHFHFVANEDAAERLVRMGEREDRIFVTGAPGLVGLVEQASRPEGWFQSAFDFVPDKKTALVVFHPVVQEAERAGQQIKLLLDALAQQSCAGVVMRPNSDAGGHAIDAHLKEIGAQDRFVVCDHLSRDDYLAAVSQVDLLAGNSSSGIIESASLGTPCLNLGSRQNGRLRNANVVDCAEFSLPEVSQAISKALTLRGPFINLYGDGKSDLRIANLIRSLPLEEQVLSKANSY